MTLKANVLQNFYKQYPDFEVVYITHYGSKLYGTNSESSDTDLKGIFIPTMESVLLKQDPDHWTMNTNSSDAKNTSEDIDCQLFSIYKFFHLLEKGETGAIDMLFSMFRGETIIHEDHDFTKMLRLHYKSFLSKNLGAFKGYSLNMAKKYGIKGQRFDELEKIILFLELNANPMVKQMPISAMFDRLKETFKVMDAKYLTFTLMSDGSKRNSNEEAKTVEYLTVLGRHFLGTINYGYLLDRLTEIRDTYGHRTKKAKEENYIDNKAISHALRIMYELEELLDTGKIRFPLKGAEEIKRIKYNTLTEDEYSDLLNDLNIRLDEIDTKIKESSIPEKADKKAIQQILLYYMKRTI